MSAPTPDQIRAARAYLNWRQEDLAERAGMSKMAIKFIEQGRSKPRPKSIRAIEAAFTAAGIEFDACSVRSVIRHEN